MRTSAKWTLAVSIVLLVAGILLTGYGLHLNMDKYIVKNYSSGGFSYMRQALVPGNSSLALCFLVYGYFVFISGLASMGYFVYLAANPVRRCTKRAKAVDETMQLHFEEKKEEVKNDRVREEEPREEDVSGDEACRDCEGTAVQPDREENQ